MERKIILKNTAIGEELLLPITPERYPMGAGRAVERLDMAQTGQISLPGLKTLFSEPLEFMLPARAYPELTSGAVADPDWYIDKLTTWSRDANVCRYVVVGTDINSPVLLGPLSWEERDGSNDVYCSLPLYEYRYLEEVRIQQTGNASRPSENSTQAQTADSYTVVSGDSLWSICRKFYGDGFLAYKLATANDIKNPNLIFPGQVLTLPAADALSALSATEAPTGSVAAESPLEARIAARSALGLGGVDTDEA